MLDEVGGRFLGGDAGANNFRPIVVALVELTSADGANAGDGGRIEALVIEAPALAADPAPTEAAFELCIRNHNEKNPVHAGTALGQCFIQCDRLGDVPREAIERSASPGVGALEAVKEHRNGDAVRDERAAIHVRTGQLTEVGPLAYVLAEHLSRRDVHDARRLSETLSLSSLPGAGRTKEDDIHDRYRMNPS